MWHIAEEYDQSNTRMDTLSPNIAESADLATTVPPEMMEPENIAVHHNGRSIELCENSGSLARMDNDVSDVAPMSHLQDTAAIHDTNDLRNAVFSGGVDPMEGFVLNHINSWDPSSPFSSNHPFLWAMSESADFLGASIDNIDTTSLSKTSVDSVVAPDSICLASDLLSTLDKDPSNPVGLDPNTPMQGSDSSILNTKTALVLPSFPQPHPEDDDVIMSENFFHVSQISPSSHRRIQTFFEEQQQCASTTFPNIKVFFAFVQLYYEYFDSSYPFIHPSALSQNEESWVLLLAVAAIGCQYSSIANADRYATVLHNLLQQALTINVRATSPSLTPKKLCAEPG